MSVRRHEFAYNNTHKYVYIYTYILKNTQKFTWASPAHGLMTGEGDCRTSSTETRRSQSAHSPLLLLLLVEGGSHAASSAGRSMLRGLPRLLVGGEENVLLVGGSEGAHGSSIVTPSLLVWFCLFVWVRFDSTSTATPQLYTHIHIL